MMPREGIRTEVNVPHSLPTVGVARRDRPGTQ